MTISSFFMRKLHSLFGVFLSLFLIEHLVTNSEMVFSKDALGFIRMVNLIHSIPYLPIVEMMFIFTPIIVHGIWGVLYLRNGRGNTMPSYKKPSLAYAANYRYSWQRITAVLLVFGIIGHIIHVKWLNAPIKQGIYYQVAVSEFDHSLKHNLIDYGYLQDSSTLYYGVAVLSKIRQAFRLLWVKCLYTLFVCAATFHAFNGLWTASLSWGVIQNKYAQRVFLWMCLGLSMILTIGGLGAIWLNINWWISHG